MSVQVSGSEENATSSNVLLRHLVLKNLGELSENETQSEVAMEYYMMVK